MNRSEQLRRSIRRHLVASVALVVLLAGGIGGWAATAELSGAVVASGLLVVDSNVKKVQHPTGGVVGELRVREGDHVRAGEILLRLDDTTTRANLEIVLKSLDELAARRARDEAERDGLDAVDVPADLLARMDDPDVARLVGGERRLFEIRRTGRAGQKDQLRERIGQLDQEIKGLTDQITAKQHEMEFITTELGGVQELYRKNLVPISRVTALQRDQARTQGENGQLIAQVAEAKGKIAETQLQILQVDADLRTEVGKDLAEIRAKASELVERKVTAEEELRRVDIRAPQDGTVHQLSVHTIGGVITPQGEPIMLIVPDADTLRVEVKIEPQDIDQLHFGQPAGLRFSAFNQRTTPELNGDVEMISPDVTQDPKTGRNFYTVWIKVPDTEIARLDGLKLIPGMPVEAFVKTSPRTMLSYLVRPLHDQVMRAFREK